MLLNVIIENKFTISHQFEVIIRWSWLTWFATDCCAKIFSLFLISEKFSSSEKCFSDLKKSSLNLDKIWNAVKTRNKIESWMQEKTFSFILIQLSYFGNVFLHFVSFHLFDLFSSFNASINSNKTIDNLRLSICFDLI